MTGVRSEQPLGTCADCGRPLPPGTLRHCVHCGAETPGDPGSPSPAATFTSASTWSSGEFRAPSPLDGPTDGPTEPVPPRPEVPGGWYSDTWYSDGRYVGGGAGGVSPAVVPSPAAPDAVPPAGDHDSRPTALVWPADGDPPVPSSPTAPEAVGHAAAEAVGHEAAGREAVGHEALGPSAPVWPGAPAAPLPPPSPEPAGLPPWDTSASQWPTPSQQAPAPAGEPGRLPVLPLVAVALALIVLTTAGLLWLNTRGSGPVTAEPAQIGGATTSHSVGAGVTDTAVAGVAPGPPAPSVAAASVTPSATASATPSGAGASSGTATTDVIEALDALLDESAAARGDVAATSVGLQTCRVPAVQAAATFRRAGESRSRLAAEATALSTRGLAAAPGAGDAVRAFIALQQASALADAAFADWADEVATAGCRGQASHTPNWALANQYSGQASVAKARFVRLWNPIAAQHQMRSRSADEI